MKYYLAIDIGASSGRHILASVKDGKIQMEEIYRFENGIKNIEGSLCWELDILFREILHGIKKCKEIGKIPVSLGIDTWGVDFVLLDECNNLVGKTVSYRDGRTQGMDLEVYKRIPEEKLYERNGIQKMIFNTVYQLMALKKNDPEVLHKADTFLMVPDYFHFLLTGKKVVEYTNATTTQLVNAKTGEWDKELMKQLGYPTNIFPEIKMAGSLLGELSLEIQKEIGFNCEVVLPPTHDTASAVVAVPSQEEKFLYISSGTWSLMGTERIQADCSELSRQMNFTNEGGFEHRFRYLKNIMGLWMIQSVQKEIGQDYTFAEICSMAEKEDISSLVDCSDEMFLAPESMTQAVQRFCLDTKQQVPETLGEVASVIYNSLADCYGKTVKELEQVTGHIYNTIHVVGGGSNADYLNHLTAKYTNKKVLAGPSEATAAGNLVVQMIANQQISNIEEARKIIYNSNEIKTYVSETEEI